MSKASVIADYNDICGECPVWDPSTRSLYWTDIAGKKFYRYSEATGKHDLVHQGLEINGFVLHQGGGFVITNSSGIFFWDGARAIKRISTDSDESMRGLNDCKADPRGRLITGSWFYDGTDDYRLGYLVLVDLHGRVKVFDESIHGSNGLGFSPDATILYFTDTITRRIYAYDYDVESASVSRRRVFVQVPESEGLPDGLAVDADGFVWSGQWYGGCVVRYDLNGKVERRVPLPAKQITSITFGGPELTDIFITSASRSEPLPIMPAGYDYKTGYFGGCVYRLNLGIHGKTDFQCELAKDA